MSQDDKLDWSDRAFSAFDIVTGEFIVVTADAMDIGAYAPLKSLLFRVRKAFGIDAVLISERADGEPMARRREAADRECDPLHLHYAMHVLGAGAARLHAVPVVTCDDIEHGTLCCVCSPSDDADDKLRALQSVAQLIAEWFEDAELSLSGLMPLRGDSMMGRLATASF